MASGPCPGSNSTTLYRVDFETQARVPKLSAAFYRDVVARNAIEV